MAIAGRSGSLWVGSTLAKVAEGTDISLSVNGKTIDSTSFDSGEWEEFINGTKSWSISFTGNFKHTDPSQVAIMKNIIDSGQAAYPAEIRLTSATAPKLSGNVITESFDIGVPVGDKVTLRAQLKGSGALTFTAA